MDINPIAEERITLAEYIKKKNILTSRRLKSSLWTWIILAMTSIPMSITIQLKIKEEQVEKITEDILNKKTETIKDWLLEVSRNPI